MNYIEAKEIMQFLLACGVKAEFWDNSETEINVYDDSCIFLFDIRSVEEWEELKKVAQKIVAHAAEPKERDKD